MYVLNLDWRSSVFVAILLKKFNFLAFERSRSKMHFVGTDFVQFNSDAICSLFLNFILQKHKASGMPWYEAVVI